jgi:uncharacterized protein (DUF4415 family)/uncharacterized DUF497 family protein
LEFTWDEAKNRRNVAKHGFNFQTAKLVFDDPYHLLKQEREVDAEPRWQVIGMVEGFTFSLLPSQSMRIVRRFELSRRERPTRKRGRSMGKMSKDKMVVFKQEPGEKLTRSQQEGFAALANMSDEDIDYSDIPEQTAAMWRNAVRGYQFFRPVKKAVSLRLDADVIAWLKKDGAGYQTRANNILRERMLRGD